MSKIKKNRLSFKLDMTPMVDVAFLLLTFFMLTAKFKSQNAEPPVDIKLPQSLADTTKLPDANLAIVTIGLDSVKGDTSIFYSLANETDKRAVYGRVAPDMQPEEISKQSAVPVKLDMLDRLIKETRLVNSRCRFAINADKRVSYGLVSDVMDVMQKNFATRFNLVTQSGKTQE